MVINFRRRTRNVQWSSDRLLFDNLLINKLHLIGEPKLVQVGLLENRQPVTGKLSVVIAAIN